jgi:acylphosphatase
MAATEQRRLRFIGQVQGVGFRYTTCQVARGYAVTGTVRNCSDGAVECVVEGTGKEINAFLAELRAAMGSYIREVAQETADPTGAFATFTVIH